VKIIKTFLKWHLCYSSWENMSKYYLFMLGEMKGIHLFLLVSYWQHAERIVYCCVWVCYVLLLILLVFTGCWMMKCSHHTGTLVSKSIFLTLQFECVQFAAYSGSCALFIWFHWCRNPWQRVKLWVTETSNGQEIFFSPWVY